MRAEPETLQQPGVTGIGPSRARLLERFRKTRQVSVSLTEGLPHEDFVVQSMTDVSPLKWHLAHTTWFFEAFVLQEYAQDYRPLDPRYAYLFNSYYVQAGARHCRAQRGYLSRPTVEEVLRYRSHVDEAVQRLITEFEDEARSDGEAGLLARVELGLNHEQQHQELMLTDLKHVFSVNPLRPEYQSSRLQQAHVESGDAARSSGSTAEPEPALHWIEYPAGLYDVGWAEDGFSFDNERPAHRVYLRSFALAERPVTSGEYLEFMESGGYRQAEHWMSDGWVVARERDWRAPYYWEQRDGEWWTFTLSGMQRVDPHEPVCHLSWYEADAFARWSGARLPTEEEWEVASAGAPFVGNLLDSGRYHPSPIDNPESSESKRKPRKLFGDVWEWTGSQYRPYPGYRAPSGALGEYNGKFMSNQFVLRGGSCATPHSHLRPTYRNFFPPDACWQFTGVRLARDCE